MTNSVSVNPVLKISEAYPLVKINVRENTNVMLWGPNGIGKTQIAWNIADEMFPCEADKINRIWFPVNGRLPEDMFGYRIADINTRTTIATRPDELPILPLPPKFAPEGVILVDELPTVSTKAMFSVLNAFFEEGRLGEHVLAPGWRKLATGNRQEDGAANYNDMGLALDDRMAHYVLEPCIRAWSDNAAKRGVDPYLIAFLNLRPEFLHYYLMVEKGMRNKLDKTQRCRPSPRKYTEQVNKYVNEKPNYRLGLIAALVGYDIAVEFEGFMRVAKELPRLSDIVADPMGTKVPDDPSAKYALVAMLIRMAEKKHIGKLIQYAQRLGREFELLFGIDLVRRDPDFANVAAFADWCVRNQDVVLV